MSQSLLYNPLQVQPHMHPACCLDNDGPAYLRHKKQAKALTYQIILRSKQLETLFASHTKFPRRHQAGMNCLEAYLERMKSAEKLFEGLECFASKKYLLNIGIIFYFIDLLLRQTC